MYDLLDRSLEPRRPASLHDLAAEYLVPGAVILDAGCRDAADLIRLVRTHDATGVGVDPVEIHVARAHAAVATAELGARIEVVQGVLEALPYPDGHFDFVWCRDVVEQVDLLVPALKGAARVLKQDGRMVVYTVFVTDLLAPQEFEMLERHMGNVSSISSSATSRKRLKALNWRSSARTRSGPSTRNTPRNERNLARRRCCGSRACADSESRSQRVTARTEDIYNHVEANLHSEVFQFLGKLQPTVYVLRHR